MPQSPPPAPDPTPWEELGIAIRTARRQLGRTQEDVARSLVPAITHQHLSDIERGRERPSLRTLRQLEAQLNVLPGTFENLFLRARQTQSSDDMLRDLYQQRKREGWTTSGTASDYYQLLPDGSAEGLTIQDEVSRFPRTGVEIPSDPRLRIECDGIVEGPSLSFTYLMKMSCRALSDNTVEQYFFRDCAQDETYGRVEVGVLRGGRLQGVFRDGTTYRHVVRLDDAKRKDEPYEVWIAVRITRPNQPFTVMAFDGGQANEYTRIRIQFVGNLPERAWFWKHGMAFGSYGRYRAEDNVPIIEGAAEHVFTRADARGYHALEWMWS